MNRRSFVTRAAVVGAASAVGAAASSCTVESNNQAVAAVAPGGASQSSDASVVHHALSEASTASGAHLALSADQFNWESNKLEVGTGIALSGGGFRAMLFHAGALMRLNEFGILSRAKRISSVSGGSIAAGYLAAHWNDIAKANTGDVFSDFKSTYVDGIMAFSKKKVDVVDALTGLLPWTSAAEQVAKSYDENLFGGRTLQDLPDEPRFVFCATNLQTGVLWRFSKPYAGDYVLGRIDRPKIPLAHAVAASSAFPPVLSPMLLSDVGTFTSWPSAPGGNMLPDLSRFRERVVLTDGGVYDNHGTEPLVKRYTTIFVSDGGAPFGRSSDVSADWISQLKRVLDVTDNQVRALRRRDLIDRFVAGNASSGEARLAAEHSRTKLGAYWGIDTDPSKLTPTAALPCKPERTHQLALIATRLSDLGEQRSKQLVNWGYAICDRCLRSHYKGAISAAEPKWPFPEESLA